MANPFPAGDPAGDPADDPLALFGPETDAAAPASKTGRGPAKARREAKSVAKPVEKTEVEAAPAALKPVAEVTTALYPSPSVLRKLAAEVPQPTPAPRDLGVEIVGPPAPSGAISFDRISSMKGLGFVEAVALIQATCDAIEAQGGSAGVPELHGLLLTADGDVILHGPPTGEPPARELAMLIHQMVAPNLMPPAGRLFVGRWTHNDTAGLTEFASELAYFARPNSRELLVALHNRCETARPPAQVHRLEPKRSASVLPLPVGSPTAREPLPPLKAWMKFHKPEVFVAAVVLFAVTTTAIATLLSNPQPAAAKAPIDSSAENSASEQAGENLIPGAKQVVPRSGAAARSAGRTTSKGSTSKGVVSSRTVGGSRNSGSGGSRDRGGVGSSGDSSGPNRRAAAVVPPPVGRRRTPEGQPSTVTIESQNAARNVPREGSEPILPSRQAPDLRIYSATDAGVEPPRLRSAELPELLIAGFEKRTNKVELVIGERGEVQQAHMIGPPQRMPDVMLLSRAKELLFDPAIRNGVPVRYRLILSWNVTP